MKKPTLPNHPIQKPDKKHKPEMPSEDNFNQWRAPEKTNVKAFPEIIQPVENDQPEIRNDMDLGIDELDSAGGELDVPGSELDDAQEKIGSEDEENNYYSIGGDNHDDLEESRID